jgi:hypothetical protein
VRIKFALTALSAATALAACALPVNSPANLAEQTTKAVYNVDVDGTEANMDDDLKKQVTRASIGDLSDKMHALGAFKSMTQTSADAEKGRYTFAADFERGILAVDVRLDPAGKIGAYRVAPASL